MYQFCHFNFEFLPFWFTAIDALRDFSFEWRFFFWDIFIPGTNEKHSEVPSYFHEVCGRIFSCILIGCTVVTIYVMVPHLKKHSFCRFKNVGDLGCIISSARVFLLIMFIVRCYLLLSFVFPFVHSKLSCYVSHIHFVR